jgi:hypothetical protein
MKYNAVGKEASTENNASARFPAATRPTEVDSVTVRQEMINPDNTDATS